MRIRFSADKPIIRDKEGVFEVDAFCFASGPTLVEIICAFSEKQVLPPTWEHYYVCAKQIDSASIIIFNSDPFGSREEAEKAMYHDGVGISGAVCRSFADRCVEVRKAEVIG